MTRATAKETSGILHETPEFDLECHYDETSNPDRLTIFAPETPNLATEWLTADRETAVSLDDVR